MPLRRPREVNAKRRETICRCLLRKSEPTAVAVRALHEKATRTTLKMPRNHFRPPAPRASSDLEPSHPSRPDQPRTYFRADTSYRRQTVADLRYYFDPHSFTLWRASLREKPNRRKRRNFGRATPGLPVKRFSGCNRRGRAFELATRSET